MRKFYLPLLCTLSGILLFTQIGLSQTNKKDFIINLGLSDEGYGYPNNLPDVPSNICPTINLYSEYFLDKFFSIGIYSAFTYSYYKFKSHVYPGSNYKDAWQGWDLGLRYTFHFNPIFRRYESTDLYLSGFSGFTTRALVFDKNNIYRDDLNYKTNAFSVGGILGGRFLITNRMSLYGEAGYSRKLFLGGGVTYHILNEKD